jgi:hypothetical protein
MTIRDTKESPPSLLKGELAHSKYELQSTGKEAVMAQYEMGHSTSEFV